MLQSAYINFSITLLDNPKNTHRMDKNLLQDIILDFNRGNLRKNMTKLCVRAVNSQNVYIFIKYLFVLHLMIQRDIKCQLIFFQIFPKFSQEWTLKLCKDNKFDELIVNRILFQYIQYLKKISLSEIYSKILHNFSEQIKNLQLQAQFFAIFNLIKACSDIINFINRSHQIIQQTYPFILDIYLSIAFDIKCYYQYLKGLSVWSLQKKFIHDYQELEKHIKNIFSNKFLINNINLSPLLNKSPSPDFQVSNKFRDFMNSENSINKFTPIPNRNIRTRAQGKQNIYLQPLKQLQVGQFDVDECMKYRFY